MQPRTIHKWLLLVLVVSGMTLATRFLVNSRITAAYQALVDNRKIVNAFLNNDGVAIQRVARQYALQYQRVVQGEIIFTSDVTLPVPHIIPVRTAVAAGVLTEEPPALLRTVTPLRFVSHGRLYAGAALFREAFDRSGYIVYTQVLP